MEMDPQRFLIGSSGTRMIMTFHLAKETVLAEEEDLEPAAPFCRFAARSSTAQW
jgi:hypothetical protein